MEDKQTALVLRCCKFDMSSKNGFVWPGVGGVATAQDWIDNNECGNGLHGWLYGQGDHRTSDYFSMVDAKWLVVKVALADVRILGGKCKFPSGEVVFVGSRSEAAKYIIENEPQTANVAVIGAVLECGYNGVVQGGALSVLTGGNYATMTGGDSATMIGGYSATMTGGDGATMTGGDSATMIGDDSATMTGGNYAKMIGGNYATMIGGYSATMTGGNYAKMTGGDGASMCFQYCDGKRSRTVIAYVGEDGIEPNVAYQLNDDHKVVKVE
jgi:hypothetical protein